MNNLGLYIHIPFCVKKCNYCDFNSNVYNDEIKIKYVNSLIKEIESANREDIVDSVFIGGGTPTAIPNELLCKIINSVYDNFNCKNTEFTVEVNPKTANYEDFCNLKNCGVNRISFGVQSANDDELKKLGRIHNFSDFLKTYENAIMAGFKNINTDIIFSLPDSNLKKLCNTLEKITEINPTHISCYSLIIEENTPFYNMKLNLPDEEEDRKMYDYICEFLHKNNYFQYEISNFSKKGFECKHNIKYWERKNYLGFGAGSASLYNNIRYQNTYDVLEYIKNNKREEQKLSIKEQEEEFIFLGLRMNKGINLSLYKELYNKDFLEIHNKKIEEYKKLGLVKTENNNLSLTHNGFSVSNEILSNII